MAGPDNEMLIAALAALGVLAVLLAVLLARRSRELRDVRDLGERFVAVAQTGDLAERLSPHAGAGSAAELAESADRLMARLERETSTRVERETVYRRLAEAMHEAVVVERDGIQVANAKFAELCGVTVPSQLVGRRLEDLVHPDFAELMAEHLRRHREGLPAPQRLEAELRPSDGHAARLEFSFAQASFDGQPALQATIRDIGARLEVDRGTGKGAGNGVALPQATNDVGKALSNELLIGIQPLVGSSGPLRSASSAIGCGASRGYMQDEPRNSSFSTPELKAAWITFASIIRLS